MALNLSYSFIYSIIKSSRTSSSVTELTNFFFVSVGIYSILYKSFYVIWLWNIWILSIWSTCSSCIEFIGEMFCSTTGMGFQIHSDETYPHFLASPASTLFSLYFTTLGASGFCFSFFSNWSLLKSNSRTSQKRF